MNTIYKESVDIIVEFCKYKSIKIKKETGYTYMNRHDYDEIRRWPLRAANEVLKSLKMSLINSVKVLSCEACPFCVLYGHPFLETCNKCLYGKRHGICRTMDSDFKHIIEKVQKIIENNLKNGHNYYLFTIEDITNLNKILNQGE